MADKKHKIIYDNHNTNGKIINPNDTGKPAWFEEKKKRDKEVKKINYRIKY